VLNPPPPPPPPLAGADISVFLSPFPPKSNYACSFLEAKDAPLFARAIFDGPNSLLDLCFRVYSGFSKRLPPLPLASLARRCPPLLFGIVHIQRFF